MSPKMTNLRNEVYHDWVEMRKNSGYYDFDMSYSIQLWEAWIHWSVKETIKGEYV